MAKKPICRPTRLLDAFHPTPPGRNVQHCPSGQQNRAAWGLLMVLRPVRHPRTPGGKHDSTHGANTG